MPTLRSSLAPCAVLAAAVLAAAPALAGQVTVNNGTQTVLYRLFTSESSDEMWGPDRLGEKVVQPGGSVVLTIPDNMDCAWDFLLVYADGVEDQMTLNTCMTDTLNLTE